MPSGARHPLSTLFPYAPDTCDAYPDGRQFVGYGIAPTVEVTRTLPDYLAGRSPALTQARAYLRQKLR